MGSSATEIAHKVKEHILAHDRLCHWLGIEVLEVAPGYAKLAMTVQDRHLNAAGVAHGGVLFSFCDIAFAIASNSHGDLALALEVNMGFLKAVSVGERLVVEAKEEHLGRRTATYLMRVTNSKGEKVAICKGTGYRFDRPFAGTE